MALNGKAPFLANAHLRLFQAHIATLSFFNRLYTSCRHCYERESENSQCDNAWLVTFSCAASSPAFLRSLEVRFEWHRPAYYEESGSSRVRVGARRIPEVALARQLPELTTIAGKSDVQLP